MGKMVVDRKVIEDVCTRWDDQDTQDLITAIKVELKKDLRSTRDRNCQDVYSELIDNIDNQTFWAQFDLLLNGFSFDY